MRTAVVTGGNRGIGYAVCESLVRKGFRVLAVVRDPSATVADGVEAVRGDLSSRRTVAALAATLRTTRTASRSPSPSTTSRRSS
jgi:NAD(P)-dependent dehydrogenase (short-subunit alcohol dehydrogenase family)